MVTTISDCEKIQNEGKKIKKKGVDFIYVSEHSLWKRIHARHPVVDMNTVGSTTQVAHKIGLKGKCCCCVNKPGTGHCENFKQIYLL